MLLVTGGTGFIGSHFCNSADGGIALVHNDNPQPLLPFSLDKFVKVRGDIRDVGLLQEIMAKYKVDQVLHLAAHSIVKTASLMPKQVFEMNAIGTLNVLEAARLAKVDHVVIQTSDKVYGEGVERTIDSPLQPSDPYGTSKVCADYIAQGYIKAYGMKIAITRPCNIYGYDLADRIIPNTIRDCLRGRNPRIFVGDESTRQYLYIDDLVQSLRLILDMRKVGPFNIATPPAERYSQSDVVNEVLKHFPQRQPSYIEKPNLPEITHQSIVCNLKERQYWTPFAEGIKMTIESFRNHVREWA